MGQTSTFSFLTLFFIASIFAFGLTSGIVTCSFETGFCGWNVTSNSNFNWLINTGNAGDRTSGLESDHTCGNIKGSYLYIRGRDAHNSTWIAIIQSQKIDLNETTNLTFWYHMNGNGIGTLSLYVVTSDNVTSNKVSTMLWNRGGRQSPDWLEAMVSLKPGIFQLEFRATTRDHFASDIGLDDIWLLSETKVHEDDLSELCKIPTTTTTPQTTTTTTRKPTTAPHIDPCAVTYSDTDLLPGSCDFETGWCNLSDVVNKNYRIKWNITSGPVGYFLSKINGDHTKTNGSGKYAYLPLKISTPTNQSAGLLTPMLPYPVCLTFWYSVADRAAKLFVLLREQDDTLTTLWSYKPPSVSWPNNIKFPQPWTKQRIPVFSTKPFSIIFQAITNGFSAEVGIDDISIQGKPLSISTQSGSSTTSAGIHTIETNISRLTTASLLTRTTSGVTLTTHNVSGNHFMSGTTKGVNIISSSATTEHFPTRTTNGSTTFDKSISVESLLTKITDHLTSVSSSATKRTAASKTTSSFMSRTTTPLSAPTSVTSSLNDGSTLHQVTISTGNLFFSNPLASKSTTVRIETLKIDHPFKRTTEIGTPPIITYVSKLKTFPTSESKKTTTIKSFLLTETMKNKTSTHEYVTDNESLLAEKGISTRDRNIIGGVIGSCLFVVLVVVILIIYFRKIKKSEELKTSASSLKRSKVHESDSSNKDRDMNITDYNLILTTRDINSVDMQRPEFTLKHTFDNGQDVFVTKF